MHCQDCRRPMHPNRQTCMYCGGQPKEDGPNFRAPRCLSCKGVMKAHPDHEKAVLQCIRCKSLWFGQGLLESLLEAVEVTVTTTEGPIERPVDPPKQKPQPVEYRRCPSCDMPMKRENYKRISGIIIDTCLKHGTYLDSGEFDALKDFIQSGGQAAADFHDDMEKQRGVRKQDRDADLKKQRAKRSVVRTSAYDFKYATASEFSLWALLTGSDSFFQPK